MKKFDNLKSKLADDLELPNDAFSDNFDLRMHGNKKVIIENHRGITAYEDNIVGVKTKDKTILIKGYKFKIQEISDYQVIVKGTVKEIVIN